MIIQLFSRSKPIVSEPNHTSRLSTFISFTRLFELHNRPNIFIFFHLVRVLKIIITHSLQLLYVLGLFKTKERP